MDSLCLWLTLFIGLRFLADFLYTHNINLTGDNYMEMDAGGGSQHSWKPRLFWAQMAHDSLVAISGLKKSRFSGHIRSNGPCNGCCPHQNHYVPRHINWQQVNSYKIGHGRFALRVNFPGLRTGCWEGMKKYCFVIFQAQYMVIKLPDE